MADKLISADKLAQNFQRKTWYSSDEVLDTISDAQGVDITPVKPYQYVNLMKCGNCGIGVVGHVEGFSNIIKDSMMNYCPMCGRKVDWREDCAIGGMAK